MILTFILALSVQPDPQITLDLPAIRLPEIAKKISEQTGEQVKITGPDPGQFVFIKVEKMPFSRLRESLSFVTGGAWAKVGEVWALQTLPSDRQSEDHHRKSVRSWLDSTRQLPPQSKEQNDELVKQLALLRDPQANRGLSTETRAQIQRRTPVFRLTAKLLQALPPAALLDLELDRRVVYSSHPTSLQLPLPPQFGQFFEEFSRDCEALDLLAQGTDRNPQDASEVAFSGSVDSALLRLVSTSLLALQRDPDYGVSAELSFYNKEGERLARVVTYAGDDSISARTTQAAISDLKAILPESVKAEIPPEQTAVTAEIRAKIRAQKPLAGQKAVLSPQTAALLQEQDKKEILALNASSLLRDLARKSGRQVVARLTDIAIMTSLMSVRQEWSLARNLESMMGYRSARIDSLKIDNDLICLAPSSVLLDQKFDRAAIVKTISDEKHGMPRMEALSYLADKHPDYSSFGWPVVCTGLFTSQAGIMQSEADHGLLRFYSLLSGEQKKSANEGGVRMTLSNLNRDQMAVFNSLFFTRLDSGIIQPASGTDEISDLLREPTVCFAASQPGKIELTMRMSRSDGFVLSSRYGGTIKADPEEVATAIFMAGREPSRPYPSQACQGEIWSLELTADIAGKLRATLTYALAQAKEGSELIPFSKLPPDLMKEVEVILARWREFERNGMVEPARGKPPVF